MLMSAPQVLGPPETHPDGGGSGGSGSSGSGAVVGRLHYHQQPQFNVKESTLIISNSSTCTLKLKGGSCWSFLKKKKNKNAPSGSSIGGGGGGSTYTVQFNKETTKTTKSSEV